MTGPEEDTGTSSSEDIKPYELHVSSKYLDLTRQKLELTRLPHEVSEAKSKDWWEPKPEVEPLIDRWLEHFSWRDQESKFNASVSQFRTSIRVASCSGTPVRIHFIHARSPHANAVPLLLIPPFPFSNLSLSHLVNIFTDPDDAGVQQPFHLVIPSLPGFGFSDALPNNNPVISAAADMLDVLMKRLDYPCYIATNAGSSGNSPSHMDWKLAKHLSMHYTASCLGFHFISPPVAPPTLSDSPVSWAKMKAAKSLRKPIFGYSDADLEALNKMPKTQARKTRQFVPWQIGIQGDGICEPNTLAYALCDSPTGLLLFMLMVLRVGGSRKQLSHEDIITMTALIWLPGPEAILRYWAYCASHEDKVVVARQSQKPKVSLTVFTGDEQEHDAELEPLPRPIQDTYSCPIWASKQFRVLSTNRVPGKAGLLAWERPEVIVQGVRQLAQAVLKDDKRMQASEHPGTALLEQVVLREETARADISGTTVQAEVGSSTELPKESPASPKKASGNLLQPPAQTLGKDRRELRPITPPSQLSGPRKSGETSLGGGRERDNASRVEDGDEDSSGEGSPDTVIAVGSQQIPSAPS